MVLLLSWLFCRWRRIFPIKPHGLLGDGTLALHKHCLCHVMRMIGTHAGHAASGRLAYALTMVSKVFVYVKNALKVIATQQSSLSLSWMRADSHRRHHTTRGHNQGYLSSCDHVSTTCLSEVGLSVLGTAQPKMSYLQVLDPAGIP